MQDVCSPFTGQSETICWSLLVVLRQRGSSEDSFLALTENGLRVLFLVGLGPEREEKAAVEIGVSA